MSDPPKRSSGFIWVGLLLFAVFGVRRLWEREPHGDRTPSAYSPPAPRRIEEPEPAPRPPMDPKVVEELEAKLVATPPDPAWSPAAEADFRNFFEAGPADDARVESMTCGGSVCRAYVRHPNARAQARFHARLPAFMQVKSIGRDRPITVVYIDRTGLVL